MPAACAREPINLLAGCVRFAHEDQAGSSGHEGLFWACVCMLRWLSPCPFTFFLAAVMAITVGLDLSVCPGNSPAAVLRTRGGVSIPPWPVSGGPGVVTA